MLYVMRHGQTDWNREYRLQGRADIPLNDLGRSMAAEAREKYGALPLDVCFCSPLMRARETAEIFLAGRQIPIISDERLSEMSFGIYEGYDHIYDHPECPIYPLFRTPERYTPTGGAESFAEAFARADSFLTQVVRPRLERNENILLVAHGAINCCLLACLNHTPLEHLWDNFTGNCEIVRIASQ